MRYNTSYLFLLVMAGLISGCGKEGAGTSGNTDWGMYLGGPGTNQYSILDQINTTNVKELKVAWTYQSGDADSLNRSQIQCNPLIIDGILYGSSPALRFFALNASTGTELWSFDPWDNGYNQFGMGVNRGVAFWRKGEDKRLLFTAGSFLYCLNANTGQLIKAFGAEGKVDLHEGLGRDVSNMFISSNTPGVVFENLLILGTRVSESTGAAPGYIRAYNVLDGSIEWVFHTIPKPGEFGYDTWPEDAWERSGGANTWSGFSIDYERGWVFAPTGSAAFDFYGGDRHGQNLFANCILALDARTGERIWHYQTVHHDVWDRDLPAPPNLIRVTHNGKKVDAVAQITKSAHVFLLDRETGEPLFPVEEVAVPPSKLKGEKTWPTQPIPTKPPAFARNRMKAEGITQRTPEAHEYVKSIWAKLAEGDPFVPPTEEGTVVLPGFDGGGEWGGGAFDPETERFYINASEMPWILQMVPYQPETDNKLASKGRTIYNSQCILCHGKDLKGASIHTVPSLVNLNQRLDKATVVQTVSKGKGMMPAFAHLSDGQVDALAAFLLETQEVIDSKEDVQDAGSENEWPYPYVMTGYNRFVDQDGYPAITPPWGTLNAIDLGKGDIAWKVPFGEFPELAAEGMKNTGSESYGGPVVTKGGLLFIGATLDGKFHVYDKNNGDLLYEYQLPAAGYATPATYMVNGRQFVVIAAGGGKLGTKSGDSYVAFSLP